MIAFGTPRQKAMGRFQNCLPLALAKERANGQIRDIGQICHLPACTVPPVAMQHLINLGRFGVWAKRGANLHHRLFELRVVLPAAFSTGTVPCGIGHSLIQKEQFGIAAGGP